MSVTKYKRGSWHEMCTYICHNMTSNGFVTTRYNHLNPLWLDMLNTVENYVMDWFDVLIILGMLHKYPTC